MNPTTSSADTPPAHETGGGSIRFLRQYWYFLRTEPEWWLLPFVVILGALAIAAWLSDSQPSFIYPIF